jgi:hypothetical protein
MRGISRRTSEAATRASRFGVGNIMRMPGRLRIAWQDDATLKLETDAGTQTRLLHFGGTPPAGGERTVARLFR